MKVAWRTLFDKRVTEETGEVDYGGGFPIGKIEQVVHSALAYCDESLVTLTLRAVNRRIEDQVGPGRLTGEDVRLYNHIVTQRDRLKKILYHT